MFGLADFKDELCRSRRIISLGGSILAVGPVGVAATEPRQNCSGTAAGPRELFILELFSLGRRPVGRVVV